MPSHFPGMDPYLEDPYIWPDLHDHLAGEIGAVLNQLLPAPYYARLEMRPEIGILDADERPRRVIPDVAVMEPRRVTGTPESGIAILEQPRTDVSEHLEVWASIEPLRHKFVEVRDSSREHKLVTLIEIVSPSNKRPGKDREAYLQKQDEILGSDANLVEIDLLRHGQRLLAGEGLAYWIDRHDPRADYVVAVNRAWKREKSELYLINIRQVLPAIGVPLRQTDEQVTLDLQFVLNRAYDRGPYRRGAVDYSRPPAPPLRPEDATWADELLAPLRASLRKA